MNDQARTVAGIASLAMAVIATAIVCVYARHDSRKQFTRLQVLIAERDILDVEWGRLQIEQSTWSTHSQVEQIARRKMHMRTPAPAEIRVVRQ